MPLSEKPKKAPNKCPNNTFNDKEKLKKIQEELGRLQAEPTNWLNESEPKVVPYDPKMFKNPEEYYKYVASSIETPEDIVAIMDGLMTYYNDPQDRMFPASTIVAAGFGDCENYSWLAKCLLDDLGCKKNFNYNSKVIGIGTHAVCIYTDEKGDTWSIDQHKKKKINTIYEASADFEKQEGKLPEEESLHNGNIQERIHLDKNLTNNYEHVTYILYDQNFDKSFDPNKILPKGWSKYVKTQLEFRSNNVIVIYTNGKIYSATDKNKKETDFFDEEGGVDQRKYSDGVLVMFYKGTENMRQKNYAEGEVNVEHFDLNGELFQRDLRNGTVENYDSKSKKLHARFFPDGNVETEFYFPDGTVKERDFRNGNVETEFYFPDGKVKERKFRDGNIEVEFYYSDGKVKERNFRKNPGVKYEIEWYDENGKLKQTKTFNGVIEIVPVE